MEEIKVNDVPQTIICSRAVVDIKNFLMGVMVDHEISADLMCMILRDVCSHFERLRADDYSMSIIKNLSKIEILQKENEELKKMTELFNTEGNADDNSEHKP